ncbi:MAG: CoA transferase subunit A [Desulfobacteraceae bacterium]|nr:CoA transferase subunit A [Desulfobacteraceae bacterium]MDD3991136.1 CoA transferase subunit A [Desulfobacteraceae bacterium]
MKLMTAAEAVRTLIKDGDQIALGGFTVNRNPMLMAREMIRQGKRHLYLVVHSHGQALELLVGAGCVQRVEIAYGGVGRFAPTGFRFKKAFLEKKIEVEDYSNLQMTLRFMAGAMGMPFVVTRSGLGTDIVRLSGFSPESRGQGRVPRQKLTLLKDPFDPDGADVVALPPLNPDVALVHAQYVGEAGTCRFCGLTFADIEQAKAAKTVIVTCEEIVPEAYLRREPDRNSLPPFLVDAVVAAPFGAHPTACHQFYDYDPKHMNLFKQIARDDDRFKAYLDEWVYPFDSQEAYLERVGVRDLLEIRANPGWGYAPGLDRR